MKPGLIRTSLAAVVLAWLCAARAPAETYYVAPNGSDRNAGTTAAAPLDSFDHAIGKLGPGDTLILADGTYTLANSGRFYARQGHNAKSGTAAAPITIKAAHERKAWVRGDGRYPFRLHEVDYWVIEGLHVSTADRPGRRGVQRGEPFLATRCDHLTIRRLLADHTNRYVNCAGVGITQCRHVLVVESELYYFHRNGFQAFQADDVTFRRCYANSRGYSDIRGGYGSHRISRNGGDASFAAYYSNHVTAENCVSENRNEGFSPGASGKNTVTGRPSGRHNRVLGCISLHDNKPGGAGSRDKGKGPQPMADIVFKDFLVIGPLKKGLTSRAVRDLRMTNVTVINAHPGGPPEFFHMNPNHQEAGGGRTIWPSPREIGGSTWRLRNFLFINDAKALGGVPANDRFIDFRLAYANFDHTPVGVSEDITDDAGQIRRSMRGKATNIGLEEGQVVVYIPRDSNMKGAGRNGADIGANILYRYVNGELTDQLLWDPETGQFPHGAVIQHINDVAGKSLFDLNERLNVSPRTLANAAPYKK